MKSTTLHFETSLVDQYRRLFSSLMNQLGSSKTIPIGLIDSLSEKERKLLYNGLNDCLRDSAAAESHLSWLAQTPRANVRVSESERLDESVLEQIGESGLEVAPLETLLLVATTSDYFIQLLTCVEFSEFWQARALHQKLMILSEQRSLDREATRSTTNFPVIRRQTRYWWAVIAASVIVAVGLSWAIIRSPSDHTTPFALELRVEPTGTSGPGANPQTSRSFQLIIPPIPNRSMTAKGGDARIAVLILTRGQPVVVYPEHDTDCPVIRSEQSDYVLDELPLIRSVRNDKLVVAVVTDRPVAEWLSQFMIDEPARFEWTDQNTVKERVVKVLSDSHVRVLAIGAYNLAAAQNVKGAP